MMAVEKELEPKVIEALQALHKQMGGQGHEGFLLVIGKNDLKG